MGSPLSTARARRRLLAIALALVAAAPAVIGSSAIAQEMPHSAEIDAAIVRAAKRHGVPEHLVRRIVMRESRYNPRARNHSFWGLMQISYPTARSMGFKGTPEQLLNPVTNLAYAVPYLANAFVAAGQREDAAVRLYASGYYATAKNRGVLGLLRTADSKPLNGVPDEPGAEPAAIASSDTGNWSWFSSGAPTPMPEQPASAPVPQQLAYAATTDGAGTAPAQAQIEALAHSASGHGAKTAKVADKNGDDGVAMVEAHDGTMAPPKRWQHDGGTSVITRGEQGLEHVAAYRLGDRTVATARRSRKTAVFAQLDASGATASASNATDAQPQPTSFYATAPQGPTVDPGQQAAAQTAANEAAGAAVPAADTAVGDTPKHRRHGHKSNDHKSSAE